MRTFIFWIWLRLNQRMSESHSIMPTECIISARNKKNECNRHNRATHGIWTKKHGAVIIIAFSLKSYNSRTENVTETLIVWHISLHIYLTKFLPELFSLSYAFPPVLLLFQSISRLRPQLVILQDFADLFASLFAVSILIIFLSTLWKGTLSSALWSSALREKIHFLWSEAEQPYD